MTRRIKSAQPRSEKQRKKELVNKILQYRNEIWSRRKTETDPLNKIRGRIAFEEGGEDLYMPTKKAATLRSNGSPEVEWNISQKGWKMPTWDGKKGQVQEMELWIEKWRSFSAEKGLVGRDAVWAFLDFLQNPALEKLQRIIGMRMKQVDDPEILIKELRVIYKANGNFRCVWEEFLNREQLKGGSLRDYMDALCALRQEADNEASTKSRNETVFRRFLEGTNGRRAHASSYEAQVRRLCEQVGSGPGRLS